MSRTRIHNLSISLDGFATGEPQSAETPFGHAGQRLHEWLFATRSWAPEGAESGADAVGSAGVDDAFAQRHSAGFGAEVVGAGTSGPTPRAPRPDQPPRAGVVHEVGRA